MKIVSVKDAPAGQILVRAECGMKSRYAIRAMDPDKEAGLLCFDAENPTAAEFVYSDRCIDLGVKAAFVWSPDLATIGMQNPGGPSPVVLIGGKILVRGFYTQSRDRPSFWDALTGEARPAMAVYDARGIAVHKCVVAAEHEKGDMLPLLTLESPPPSKP